MPARSLTRFLLGIVVALPLAGCTTFELNRAASERVDRALLARKPSSLAGWQDEDSERWASLKITEARSAIILHGWDHVAVKSVPSPRGKHAYHVAFEGSQARSLGTAVPVSADGYFLTAAHCVSDAPPFTLIALDRELHIVKTTARVVWTGISYRGGPDLAILHAPIEPATPFRLADFSTLAPREPVAIAGWSGIVARPPTSSLAAGRILAVSPLHPGATGFAGYLIEHDAPLNQGDSGGPVITADARLAGVNSTVRLSTPALLRIWSGREGPVTRPLTGYTAHAYAPDRAWLQRILAADRAARGAGVPVR